jgi:hypothetical protein
MAKEKGTKEKGTKEKRAKVLGPGTIVKPALVGVAILTILQVALKG